MKRTPIERSLSDFPEALRPFLDGAKLYDSSCSREARVVYVEKDGGYYLKSAPKGTLLREAEMARFYHAKGLGAEVLGYESAERDWLLTSRVAGEDCTHALYLGDPVRLCDTLAQLLRELHETDGAGCPVKDHTARYLGTVKGNYEKGQFDPSYLPQELSHLDIDGAYRFVTEHGNALESNTLLHGDYCLPNVMLDGWRFSGFIDLGNGGIGDRHVDLFWGAWTLNFNLGTEKYRERFFDAYGRDKVDRDRLLLVGAAEAFG